MRHLFLLDVDSVLVEAQGYLKALQDTVAIFARRMGLPELYPVEDEVRAFEANGLSSEWDSGAACVAVLLLERLRKLGPVHVPASWTELLAGLADQPGHVPRPDYATLANRVGSLAREQGISPTEAMRAIIAQDARDWQVPPGTRNALEFILDALVGHTHDFYRAPITRVFQHLAIGSQSIPKTYGVPADFDSPAYLERFDRPLLSPIVRERLMEAGRNGVSAVLYTARPSLPPAEAQERLTGYSPEAEIARDLVGLQGAPLIALGRMRWLAEQSGERSENLVKPSPVQALAAIGAAFSGQEIASLQAALALYRTGDLQAPLSQVDGAMLHVFEDTPGGLQAAEQATHMLAASRVRVAWQPYGIVPASGSKAAAMRARAVPTFANVDDAITAALQGIGG